MASSKDYLQFVLEQLSELQEITYRAMMGEFIIYYRGKIVGGIYDDRLLVKPTKSAISYMPTVTYEIPYENVNINLYGLALCGGYANIRQERTNVSPESFRRWCSRCRKSHRFGPLPACPG